jgi:AcrR family transcriptional regulator
MKRTSKLSKIEAEKVGKRGEGTRYALILSGLELFGEYGLKGTTTRMIADHSKANISAIKYYFGGKEGLYFGVIEHISQSIARHTDNAEIEISRRILARDLSKDEALTFMKNIVMQMARMFVELEDLTHWNKIIMREQANPTEGFDILYKQNFQQNHFILINLMSIYSGIDPESDEIKIRWHALFGQILAFSVSRECLLRSLKVEKLDNSHINLIYKVLLSHLEACLQTPHLGDEK